MKTKFNEFINESVINTYYTFKGDVTLTFNNMDGLYELMNHYNSYRQIWNAVKEAFGLDISFLETDIESFCENEEACEDMNQGEKMNFYFDSPDAHDDRNWNNFKEFISEEVLRIEDIPKRYKMSEKIIEKTNDVELVNDCILSYVTDIKMTDIIDSEYYIDIKTDRELSTSDIEELTTELETMMCNYGEDLYIGGDYSIHLWKDTTDGYVEYVEMREQED